MSPVAPMRTLAEPPAPAELTSPPVTLRRLGEEPKADAPRPKSLFGALHTGGIRAADEPTTPGGSRAPLKVNTATGPQAAAPLVSPVHVAQQPKLAQAARVAHLIGRLDVESEQANPRRLSGFKPRRDASRDGASREASTETTLSDRMTRVARNLARRPHAENDVPVAMKPRRSSLLATIAAPMRPLHPSKSDLRAMSSLVVLPPTVGVSLTRLVALFAPDKLPRPDMSTLEAVEHVVKPVTDGALLARYLTAQSSSAVKPVADACVIHDAAEPVAGLVNALLVSGLSVDDFVNLPELCGTVDNAEVRALPRAVLVLSDESFSVLRQPQAVERAAMFAKSGVPVVVAMPRAALETFTASVAEGNVDAGALLGLFEQVDYADTEAPFECKEALQPLLRDFVASALVKALDASPSPQHAASLNDALGSLHFVLREFADAQRYFERAVEASRTAASGQALLSGKLSNLAACLVGERRFIEAAPVLDEAAALLANDGGEASLGTVVTLAQLMFETDRVWEGRDLLQARLENDKLAYGRGDVRVADAQVALANYLQAVNDIMAAKQLLVDALDTHAKALGENAVEVAADCSMIGIILAECVVCSRSRRRRLTRHARSLNMYAEARQYLERALRVRESLDAASFETAQALNVLAFLLLQVGETAKANALGSRACDLFARHVAADNALLFECRALWRPAS